MTPIRAEDKRRYPRDWPEISKAIRFGRAGGRCECAGECGTGHEGRCEARQGQPHPVTRSKVVLTTAHRDHQPENCDPANLFAACQRCHLAYDAEHHRANAAWTRAGRPDTQLELFPSEGTVRRPVTRVHLAMARRVVRTVRARGPLLEAELAAILGCDRDDLRLAVGIAAQRRRVERCDGYVIEAALPEGRRIA